MRQVLGGKTVAWAALVLAGVLAAATAAAPPPGSAPGARPAPPSPAPAPAPAPGGENVSVSILGIRATKEDKAHVDPALQAVAERLRSPKYNSFRLAVSDTRNVPVGGMMEVALVEDYAMRIQVEKASNESAQITLSWMRVEKNPQGKTQMRTVQRMQMTILKGRYSLSGGWELKSGGALWGAVAVR